jgi:hypothetical protein
METLCVCLVCWPSVSVCDELLKTPSFCNRSNDGRREEAWPSSCFRSNNVSVESGRINGGLCVP